MKLLSIAGFLMGMVLSAASAHAGEQYLSCGHVIQGTSGTTGCIWMDKQEDAKAAPAVSGTRVFGSVEKAIEGTGAKIVQFFTQDDAGNKQVCTDEVIPGTSGTTGYRCRDL